MDGDPPACCGWEREGQWLARIRFGDTLRYVIGYLHHDGVVVIVQPCAWLLCALEAHAAYLGAGL